MTASPIATQSPKRGCIDDPTNDLSFDSKATWVNWCAWLILLTFYPFVFHNQTLADIWSTVARIKCLYCTFCTETKMYYTFAYFMHLKIQC